MTDNAMKSPHPRDAAGKIVSDWLATTDGNAQQERDNLVGAIATALHRAEKRGYKRGVKELAKTLTATPKERYDSIKSVRP